ncbi:MAG TPA: MarR family winged helix-turn-helix transcriptional regulator [Bryobacteraceae bacterium]|jgi:DNA-binding MarR family transcriptional regulator|nr:MarR family winged helix-turn-helix transcriptional regulator [Bryobacteraceae bacterium]
MRTEALEPDSADALFDLPCACQDLRRATRIVTRIYDQELKKAGLEITQFGLLTALARAGEVNQKRLSEGFVMDSTTLTRTLDRMRAQGWISVKQGRDRRERLFSLTAAGKRQMAKAKPYWDVAESRLRNELGESGWKEMKEAVTLVTKGAMKAQSFLQR